MSPFLSGPLRNFLGSALEEEESGQGSDPELSGYTLLHHFSRPGPSTRILQLLNVWTLEGTESGQGSDSELAGYTLLLHLSQPDPLALHPVKLWKVR